MSYTPEVITLLALNVLFFCIATLCLFISINILKNWDMNTTTSLQYRLEKQSVLVATFIKYIFILKLPLFLFFIFSVDKISGVITGAMCAAGVVNSVDFGMYLVVLKLFNLYLFGFWLVLHVKDQKSKKREFTKIKFWFFAVAYIFLILEVVYEFSFFNALEIDKIVSCCGTLFSAASSSSLAVVFSLTNTQVLVLFYGMFLLHIFALFRQDTILSLFSSIIFLIISIIALILFFGTYIYELPTHHCPFCFLQKEYYYIGYIIYITLFLATFFSFSAALMERIKESRSYKKYYMISLIFTLIFTLIISGYPLVYFLKNGVWL
ncbi:MAG: hypothetical protein IBX44_01940 [Sulfurospirillum sp.]|nr:hypothetical protein [Sulfurospirillum sp.]